MCEIWFWAAEKYFCAKYMIWALISIVSSERMYFWKFPLFNSELFPLGLSFEWFYFITTYYYLYIYTKSIICLKKNENAVKNV